MGAWAGSEIDAWLRSAGCVLTASDRATRAIRSAFNRARLTEGLSAWPAAKVLDWKSFVRQTWEYRAADGRLVLNPTQEQALWSEIVGESRHLATILEGPRHRLAAMAMEAHGLLCSFAPHLLQQTVRTSWQQDAGAFSRWLAAFDETCRAANSVSPSRLPLELIRQLENDATERPPLLLVGFDRIPPVQRSFLDAWGVWREAAAVDRAGEIHFYEATDFKAEVAACALWCNRQLAENSERRLLVVTQEASARRGELERAFFQYARSDNSGPLPNFEFSLGVPLSQVAVARGACLLLRWLTGPLLEHELDWLLSTGQIAAGAQESLALQAYLRTLRRHGLERTHWTLPELIAQRTAPNSLPAGWADRMTQAQRRLNEIAHVPQSPLEWAGLVPELLELAGWPGARPLSSAEFQAYRRWQFGLENAGSLGFDGRRMVWQDFLGQFRRTLDETLFAPESHDAPIQIAGPAESAGLAADAIWFLGASEDGWPPSGPMHPLLPPEVQRQSGMPHGTAQLDWELARTMSARLLASAPEVHFSFALRSANADARPSRIILDLAGLPQPLPAELIPEAAPAPLTVGVEDFSRVPFPGGEAPGGSSVLTAQSQCAFKAFATARLAAKGWEAAEPCLTASQRGNLLHAVMHSIWAGPPAGIRSLYDLESLSNLHSFVAGHVEQVLAREIPAALRRRMPRRYLELEGQRLSRLIAEWMDFEATRWPFAAVATEVDSSVTLAGLKLRLRLDRVDRLLDGSLLVIDYKTGDVSPKAWDLPRPDDVQLPLYASYALDRENQELGGLVFAKIRTGNRCFAGQVGDAKALLLGSLTGNSALVKNPLTLEQLLDWREAIEQLARDFVAGRAEVNPRDYPKTCEHCGLQALCRVQENQMQLLAEDESPADSVEAVDE